MLEVLDTITAPPYWTASQPVMVPFSSAVPPMTRERAAAGRVVVLQRGGSGHGQEPPVTLIREEVAMTFSLLPSMVTLLTVAVTPDGHSKR